MYEVLVGSFYFRSISCLLSPVAALLSELSPLHMSNLLCRRKGCSENRLSLNCLTNKIIILVKIF
jgi:hypothetical protein